MMHPMLYSSLARVHEDAIRSENKKSRKLFARCKAAATVAGTRRPADAPFSPVPCRTIALR